MAVLVGRGAAVAQVAATLDRAARGSGSVLLVRGEAGVGKSAVAAHLARAARARGVRVARAQAVDDPGAPPLWPWRRLAPALVPEVVPAGDDGATPTGPAARFRLFCDVTDRLRSAAADGGLVVVLEDLHWADRTSLLLLRHVAREVDGVGLVVAATYRDPPQPTWGPELADVGAQPSTRVLALRGLDPAAVDAWAEAVHGARPPAGWAREACERTGGNPLLVHLLLGSTVPGAGPVGLPEHRGDLHALVASRLDDLDAGTRDVVTAAAVLAEEVRPELLAPVVRLPRDALEARLDEAVRAGVLRSVTAPGTGHVLRFEHALVRDSVLRTLAPGVRAAWHERAAEALEQARPVPPAALVAAHWSRSHGADAVSRCLAWARRATAEAVRAHAPDEAVASAALAVSCATTLAEPDEVLAQLHLDRARASFAAVRVPECLAACRDAAEHAERARRPDLLAAAALVVHGVGSTDVSRLLRELSTRALRHPGLDPTTRARLLAQVAAATADEEPGPGAAALAAEALDAAERTGDRTALLEALAARHLAVSVPSTVHERLALAGRATEVATGSGSDVEVVWGHLWRVDAALQLGDLVAVDHELAQVDHVARRLGSPTARWHHHRLTATRLALVGSFDAAVEHGEAARALGERIGDVATTGVHLAFRIGLSLVRGVPDPRSDEVLRALAHAPSLPVVAVSVPLLRAVRGELEEARAEVAALRHLATTLPVGPRWEATLVQLGSAAALVDDAGTAAAVHDALLPTAPWYGGDGTGAVYSLGAATGLLGDLARVAGRREQAAAHYADAVARDDRLGARPAAALARLGWARLLAGGPAPDRSRSRELAAAAAAELRRLGMAGHLAVADAVLAGLTRADREADPLTARESEVAELVAQALPNREIARRLVVSERTVETHVRAILAKLGLGNRVELVARWSSRRPG